VSRTSFILGGILLLCLASAAIARFRHHQEAPLARLRIEVLNGCGEEGAAAVTAQKLRSLGQDVVKVADAGRKDYDHCVLVDRRGRAWLARRLARRLGGVLVVLERRAGADVDLTLIVGSDYAAIPGPKTGL
jgi:hypothetical protein